MLNAVCNFHYVRNIHTAALKDLHIMLNKTLKPPFARPHRCCKLFHGWQRGRSSRFLRARLPSSHRALLVFIVITGPVVNR